MSDQTRTRPCLDCETVGLCHRIGLCIGHDSLPVLMITAGGNGGDGYANPKPCRWCGGLMTPSKVMLTTTHTTGVWVDCMKCTACGWSVVEGAEHNGFPT